MEFLTRYVTFNTHCIYHRVEDAADKFRSYVLHFHAFLATLLGQPSC
jgi:hypothetical protein